MLSDHDQVYDYDINIEARSNEQLLTYNFYYGSFDLVSMFMLFSLYMNTLHLL